MHAPNSSAPSARGVTLLWALRSPCNLGCRYCYFGSADSPRESSFPGTGQLSHRSEHDLSLQAVLRFVATISSDVVDRVFLAGGEPLVWSGTLEVARSLAKRGVDVIICTNGQPLCDASICAGLVDLPVRAVSVSLDSSEADYNDTWRVDRRGRGWQAVIDGIRTLLQVRATRGGTTKIGVYAVITKKNIHHMTATAAFVQDLGVDYFVVQPVSLARDHPLHTELSLSAQDHEHLTASITAMRRTTVGIRLSNPSYLDAMLSLLSPRQLPVVEGCFGGRDLFFIEPDGSVWDCPSAYKIAATRPSDRLMLGDKSASEVFSVLRRSRNTDCALFSEDCVNMWQLMAFDELLH